MVKEPRAGRVKTRLGRDIGMVAAVWWFRQQTGALLRRLRDPRWQIILAVSPDREGMQSRMWPTDLERIPQGRGSLGDRMARLLRDGARGPILVIGADIPDITRAHIASAFRDLGRCDVVVGPAPDGGFWLIGSAGRHPFPPGLFRDVRWSTGHALADTLATLPDHRICTTATLRDVDTARDLLP